jgi:hypothetical protein
VNMHTSRKFGKTKDREIERGGGAGESKRGIWGEGEGRQFVKFNAKKSNTIT